MRPTGTVTFLMSDIEGSTRLLRAMGVERYEAALQAHRALLRDAFARYAGFEVGTEGDSFFVAFGRAQDAVRAALAAQCALAGHVGADNERIRVRIGIHTCEATVSGDNYVGMGVHRTARISATGHGGQIVLSQTTRELLQDDAGMDCLDLGLHPLKDFEAPQRLYQLLDSRLPREFPPLRTARTRPTNIPPPPTPLVGRETELAALHAQVRRPDVRLITLTGPGGTGKTRLALETAVELANDFEGGAHLVALQAIRDPELLLPAIAQALGVSQAAGQSLSAYLAPKELLLVLDNFEQIVAGAGMLAELLAASPSVKLLVTSREPLRIAGEQVFPVPPLALPDPRRVSRPEDLAPYASARLFIERAQSAQPDFRATPENAAAIAELCVRLDGLPLAIELAAARVSLLSPAAILKRLGDRLKFLTGGARDLPQRQQTLRNTLQWSHELLDLGERTLFARLAVFAAGFTIEAAEAVCDAEIDTLAALVDRSMVRRTNERFELLETIRDFALELLTAGTDGPVIRDRHAAHFEALAERAYARRSHHEQESLDELEREHDNLRAALDHLHAENPRRELRLAGALGWFWHVRSHYREGRIRLAQALAAAPQADPWRARALAAAGELAAWSGDLDAARPLIEEAVMLWRAQGQTKEIPFALIDLGWGCFYAGDPDARRLMEEGLQLQQVIGDPLLVNRARVGLLQVLVGLGELDLVEPMAREALALAEATRDARSEHLAHHFLADCLLIRGDCASALPRYRRSLALAVEINDRAEIGYEVQGIAMANAGCGQPELALRLAGAAAAEFDALAIDLSGPSFWTALLERYLGQARSALGEKAADAAWEEGRRTDFEYAIALARDGDALPAPPGQPPR
jgi:predicted ATPase/class 3 adenylate cyclase